MMTDGFPYFQLFFSDFETIVLFSSVVLVNLTINDGRANCESHLPSSHSVVAYPLLIPLNFSRIDTRF